MDAIKKKTLLLFLIGYLLYAGILAFGSRVGFPERPEAAAGAFPYLADKPVGEDGFYMLTVAWNRVPRTPE